MRHESPGVEITRRVAAGLLPPAGHFRAFAGRSCGTTCDGCGQPIVRSDIQYEVDVMDASERLAGTVMMHAACHLLWLELSRDGARLPGESDP